MVKQLSLEQIVDCGVEQNTAITFFAADQLLACFATCN